MGTYTEPEKLAEALSSAINSYRRVIAIDGVDGSGKSYLARRLAEITGWPALHLDDYLQKNQGVYIRCIDSDRLRADIKASTSHVLVEGVCVLSVLKRVNEKPASHIYVKRLDRYGVWLDEDESCFECSAEQKISELSAQATAFEEKSQIDNSTSFELDDFRSEVIRYHADMRPFKYASFIYERIDNSNR